MSLPGLQGADADAKYGMRLRVINAKWLLWHGQQARCLERLESLRRDTGLTYDSVTDTYHYVWKTAKEWSGTCRQLTLRLKDGIDHTARFDFR